MREGGAMGVTSIAARPFFPPERLGSRVSLRGDARGEILRARLETLVSSPGGVPDCEHNYGSGFGKTFREDDKADIDEVRDRIIKEYPGWKHVGGGTDIATGKQIPEVYVPGAGGTQKGSVWPDLTFQKPDGTLHHPNTVDTLADGVTMSKREAANLERLQKLKEGTGDTFGVSAKPKPVK
jgi:hypothetical protein